MQIEVVESAQIAAEVAALRIAQAVTNAVRRRGRASIAVSGGSTPAVMLSALAAIDLPWHAVEIFQVDERICADGDPRRNAHLLDTLRPVLPFPTRQLRLMPVTAARTRLAATRYAASLPDRFDIVHLGLGEDGHTASWPPGDPVAESPDPVAVTAEFNGTQRMTLTACPINAARKRLVLVAGASKSGPLTGFVLDDRSLPISRIRRTGTLVVADCDAAGPVIGLAGAD